VKFIKNLTLFVITFLAIVIATGFSAKSIYAQPDKVTVCHNGNTIEISTSALAAHLEHGDTEGPCPPAVPEFGLITGSLALIGSAGSFLILKRKKS